MSKVAVKIIIIITSILVACGILVPVIYFNWDFIQYNIFKIDSSGADDIVIPPYIPPVEEEEEETPEEEEEEPEVPIQPEEPEEPEIFEEPELPEEPVLPEPVYRPEPTPDPDPIPEPIIPNKDGVAEQGPEYKNDSIDPDIVTPEIQPEEPEEPNLDDFEDIENIVDPIDPERPSIESDRDIPNYSEFEDPDYIVDPEDIFPVLPPDNPETPDDPFPEEPEVQLTEEQIRFNDLVDKLSKLENMAKLYYQGTGEDYIEEMIKFVRTGGYSGGTWDTLVGAVDEDFVAYVQDNQGDDNLMELRNSRGAYAYFDVPFMAENIDFFHLFAVLDAEYSKDRSIADLCGWGGDMVQLLASLQGTELTGQALENYVNYYFNKVDSSGFGPADVRSDLDGTNIIARYKTGAYQSFTECFVEYYKEVTNKLRKKEFEEAVYDGNCTASKVKSSMKTTWIQLLALTESVSLSGDLFDACCKVFADYINS